MSLSRDGVSILIAILILNAIGTVMIFSSSAVYADKYYDDSFFFLKRQCVYFLVGFVLLLITCSLDLNWLRKYSRWILVFAIGLLILVYLPFLGKVGGGAKRWIYFLGFNFQPVEFVKVAVALYLADYLSRKIQWIQEGSLRVFIAPVLLLGVIFGLIILQPDLGSVVFLFLLSGILFFLSGIRIRYIIFSLLAALPFFAVAIIKAPYRLNRIMVFLNPWQDPQGSGFQIIQSFLSFGLGGLYGVGLGESVQKLFYLPQSYTDFIFSITAEELGLLGTVFILLIFVFVAFQGVRIARKVHEPFMQLLAYSVVLLISLQAIINMLVSTGMIPTKGLPLPFISYGGSALICNMLAIGILLAVDRQSQKQAVLQP